MQHLGPLFVRSIQKRVLELIRTAWHDPARITQETRDGYTLPLKADGWDQALWFFTMASRDTGLLEHLQDFKVPILVITGEDDRIVPTADSVKLAGELPEAQLVIIPESGHVPHEELPALLLSAVDGFMQALP